MSRRSASMLDSFCEHPDFKSFLAKPGDDELSEADRKLVMSTALHAADISNTAKKGELYLPWMHRVMSEFYAQGDAERSGALPVSAFMDRSKPAVAKCQQGCVINCCAVSLAKRARTLVLFSCVLVTALFC